MDVVEYILKRARSGRGVSVSQGEDGSCWADIDSRWVWGRATSIELSREQYRILRYGLIRNSRRRTVRAPAVACGRAVGLA